MNRTHWYGPTVLLLATILITMVAGPWAVYRLTWAQDDAEIQMSREKLQNSEFLRNLSESFRSVADSVKHNVVSVEALVRSDGGELTPMEQLRRRFGPQLEPRQDEPEQEPGPYDRFNPRQQRGAGSGWVYEHEESGEKYIVTNYHVVARADEIRVRFVDGSEHKAQVLGYDQRTDVAVLSVEANGMHAAELAPEPVQQGDIVLAFGSPFRFDFSISQGIVSAKGRELHILGSNGYENFIQTDAAINPGNSGGPLTNIYGQVVGMNTAIASRTGTNNGLGFAIPVQMVRNSVDQIIENPDNKVHRGFLGIEIRDLTQTMAETFRSEGFEGNNGVFVVNPINGTPAAEAGIRDSDIITELNGEAVEDADALRTRIANTKPDTTVELTIFRNGETITQEVTLGKLPEPGQVAQRDGRNEQRGEIEIEGESPGREFLRKLGIERVQTFTEQMARRTDIDHRPGVLVRGVRSGSVADREGVSDGTLILRIMGEEVSDADELLEQIEGLDPDMPVRMRVAQWDPRNEAFRERSVFLQLPN